MSIVETHNLSFAYAKRQANILDGVSISIQKGEIVGIAGPSGSGKSTLLRLIAGLETPQAGTISILGRIVTGAEAFVPPERRGVGMVFQDYALFPHLTVAKNVEFGLYRLGREERKARMQEMLELVELTGFEKRYPHELSGGQQQRVALARALAPQPVILLMDEPFSNLDAGLKAAIRSDLREILKKSEMTCLFVTHDQQDVDAICDRTIEL
ncbi:iron(III) transport system ATP-binding protein [Tumebacillus sp. BK434]|uniref:ABC transporter ATP-binding protein n=1 Tax=Tumebacillus sp. BK434 TaxID=2512169 RepID=UPI0010435EDA|nr:ABC transporter ATP-binding protein [Tumebacillus sp. BK434]TCP57917.1 iron(III) transport system ATP-binding protein [Tumebacillus sp. BK434]